MKLLIQLINTIMASIKFYTLRYRENCFHVSSLLNSLLIQNGTEYSSGCCRDVRVCVFLWSSQKFNGKALECQRTKEYKMRRIDLLYVENSREHPQSHCGHKICHRINKRRRRERNQPKHQKSSENKIEKVEKTNEQIDVSVEHKLLCELTFMCFACALDGNHQSAVPMSVCVRVYVIGKLGGH